MGIKNLTFKKISFSKIILFFKQEQRKYLRKPQVYTVACKPFDFSYQDYNGSLGSDELLTRTEDVSQGGMCLNWPINFKCHFCKHKIDIGRGNSCELSECKFLMSGFKIGEDLLLTMEVNGKIVEDIQAKIVWHKEAKKSSDFYGKMGLEFYQPLEIFEAVE